MAQRVAGARQIQAMRFKEVEGENTLYSVNAEAKGEVLEKAFILEENAKALLHKAADYMKFSARTYYRLIRVACTIADLEGVLGPIKDNHIAEALSYRKISLSY